MIALIRSIGIAWKRSISHTAASSRSASERFWLSGNCSTPGQRAGHSARRNKVANPGGSALAPEASRAGTSAQPLKGGAPINFHPVISTIAPRPR